MRTPISLILSYYSASSLQHHLIPSDISALYSSPHAEYLSDTTSQVGHFTAAFTEFGCSQKKKNTHRRGGAGGTLMKISHLAFNSNGVVRMTRFHY